ncbi:MAG: hypothetical protein ACE5R4_18270 [Armatimonadota bacterium]
MRMPVIVAVVIALCLCSTALAQQIGGPSGPDKGEFRVGGEAIFRTNVDSLVRPYNWRMSFKTRTYWGVLEYGITDCLSIRGKAGVSEFEEDAPPSPYKVKFDSGLAWAAGFRWRICKPEEHGTALALSGQYIQTTPDDFAVPGATPPEFLQNVKTREWTGALTVGVPHGSARPYAGVVYADGEADLDDLFVWEPVAPNILIPLDIDKRHHVGAVVGIDHDLGGSGFCNLEARMFDEEGISGSINLVF